MTNFSHLQKLDVSVAKTVPYTIYQIADAPELQLMPATEVNKPFFNTLLRRARRTSKAVNAGAINANLISTNRDEDRELYALHIVKGWLGVKDSDGKDVIFSPATCAEFLKALPDYIFDGIREFASNAMNFVEQDAMDVETTAKN